MDAIYDFVRTLPGNPWGVLLILILFVIGTIAAGIVFTTDPHHGKIKRIKQVDEAIERFKRR